MSEGSKARSKPGLCPNMFREVPGSCSLTCGVWDDCREENDQGKGGKGNQGIERTDFSQGLKGSGEHKEGWLFR